MLGLSILSGTALLAFATAQTAPGFPIQVDKELSVAYGAVAVDPPGKMIPQDDTASPPSNISTPVFTPSGANGPDLGVLLMVDKDVPVNGSRVQLIHWVAIDVKVGAAGSYGGSDQQRALTITNSPVPYLPPSPPAGDFPHDYSFIFYAQPANFSIPATYANLSAAVPNRIGFNVMQFVKDLKLGEPLAGNYMRVQNTTAISSTMSFPPIQTGPATATAMSMPSATKSGKPMSATAMASGTRAGNGTVKFTSTATPVPFTGQAGSSFVVEGRVGWMAAMMALGAGAAAFVL